VFFRAISRETVPNVTDHHFFDVFVLSYFLITNMRIATEDFSVIVFLLLLNWSWSYTFGLGLTNVVLVLVWVLVLTFWSRFHHWWFHSMISSLSLHQLT